MHRKHRKGSGVMEVLGRSSEKYFRSQNDNKFRCILIQFLTGRKHGQLLEALGHGFHGLIAKRRSRKQCENCP